MNVRFELPHDSGRHVPPRAVSVRLTRFRPLPAYLDDGDRYRRACHLLDRPRATRGYIVSEYAETLGLMCLKPGVGHRAKGQTMHKRLGVWELSADVFGLAKLARV